MLDKLHAVRSRFQLIVLLSAWLVAAGVPWDALQVVAWGRMFVDNSRTLPLLAAMRQTFDAKEMCGMCCAVQQAKREQRAEAVAGVGADKAPLVLQAVARVGVVAPEAERWTTPSSQREESRRDRPPLPPPRGIAA